MTHLGVQVTPTEARLSGASVVVGWLAVRAHTLDVSLRTAVSRRVVAAVCGECWMQNVGEVLRNESAD